MVMKILLCFIVSISLCACRYDGDTFESNGRLDKIGGSTTTTSTTTTQTPVVTTTTTSTTTTQTPVVTTTTTSTTTTQIPVVTTTTTSTSTTQTPVTTTSTTTIQTPVTTTTTSTTTTLETLSLQVPSRVGTIDEDCTNKEQYNACTFDYTSRRQLDLNNQNYAINILDTINNFLENDHYKIKINISNAQRTTLDDDKWTVSDNDINYTRRQAGTYHWIMYQKEWMELNGGKWYASERNINVTITNNASAYFYGLFNIISLGTGFFGSVKTLFHEAGHANFHYSGNDYRHDTLNTEQCPSNNDGIGTSAYCCKTYEGCIYAINEGQADFHSYLIDPEKYKTYRSYYRDNIYFSCIFPYTTAQDIFNNCLDNGDKGQVHVVGISVYTNIWHKIYSHSDTSHKDIAILFTEHLPLLSYQDTFVTAGTKIINLASQITDRFTGPNKDEYAAIISSEFSRMGLNLE